jgi:hypothetical protein
MKMKERIRHEELEKKDESSFLELLDLMDFRDDLRYK